MNTAAQIALWICIGIGMCLLFAAFLATLKSALERYARMRRLRKMWIRFVWALDETQEEAGNPKADDWRKISSQKEIELDEKLGRERSRASKFLVTLMAIARDPRDAADKAQRAIDDDADE